jgi:rhodanese-related sulfurtransferase
MSAPSGCPEPIPPRRAPAATSSRKSVHDLLIEARAGLRRVTASEAFAAVASGRAVLIDTRSEDQRAAQGYVREARHHALSVLEWRLCPESGHADDDLHHGSWIILLCREGYSSSLAAARLQALGFMHATDVIDGVDGWIAAGLPVHPTPT